MGLETHLHVCRNCQTVAATGNVLPPKACTACGARRFSEMNIERLLEETDVAPD